MSGLHDTQAAQAMPVGSIIHLLPEEVAHDTTDVFSDTEPATQQERQRTLQRILVVEDDPTLATLEAEVLTAYGYTVVIVPNGELAIATLHTFFPDLVVLDLELSGPLNGGDILQVIRSQAAIPVLFTSSSVQAVRRFIRSRDETRLTLDHLPKPYPIQTLLKRVNRMLIASS